MKQFKEYERLAYSFINDNDYYIIFNDGKPIRSNLEEDMVEISLDSNIDSFDICRRCRPNEEEDIISNAHFNNCINIKKDIDLKIIYLNDDEDNLSFSFDIERNVKVNMIHIVLACQRDCRILRDYNLNDNVLLNNITFNNYENKVIEHNNYYLDDKASLVINDLNINENESDACNNIYLYSEGANVAVNNSAINASGKNQINGFNIYHNTKNTKSELIGYAVALNCSKLNMDTAGYIKNKASKTNMMQKSKGIILDIDSKISASPELYIDEFDCMASHGASIGSIDEADIYYLMSRGLSRHDAEKLIVYGFFNPYLANIKDDNVLSYIKKIIESKLEIR